MCGIAGIYSSEVHVDPSAQAACRRMLNALSHRGPDARGLYQDDGFVLGHQRLSIIDLSQAANQPLSNEEGTIWLACNGEIYNYRDLREELKTKGHCFKSETDSEVIIHLYEEYGELCLNHLRGMFAFALWDQRTRRLFLARDRFGIKPLYYWNTPSLLLFASETRAIIASGLVPETCDDQALLQFLQYGSIPSPLTVFQGVHSLPAGHFLVRDRFGIRIQQYWSLTESLEQADEKPVDLDAIRELLGEAIKQHLASDVPIGISLSGGLDSSTLAAFASQGSGDAIHTLTLAFHEDPYDESQFARLVSDRFGTHHHEHKVDASIVATCLPAFFEAMDQPTVDGLNTYMVAQAAKEQGLRVLISGLGGDELFAGYPHFRNVGLMFQSLPLLKQMPKSIRSWILAGSARMAKWAGLYGADRIHYLKDPSAFSAYRVYRGLFPPKTVQALLHCDEEALRPPVFDDMGPMASGLDRALYLEFSRYLHDQLLRDTDVMSMCHSVEVRVPFLDHQLVEMVLRISARRRFDRHVHKALLRQVLRGRLPEVIVNRPKQTFTFPLADWMRSSLKSHIEEVLLDDGNSATYSFLDRNAVREVWNGFLEGKLHWSQPWSLFILKRWLQYYGSCHPEEAKPTKDLRIADPSRSLPLRTSLRSG